MQSKDKCFQILIRPFEHCRRPYMLCCCHIFYTSAHHMWWMHYVLGLSVRSFVRPSVRVWLSAFKGQGQPLHGNRQKSCESGSSWINEGLLSKHYTNISYSRTTNRLAVEIHGSKVKVTEYFRKNAFLLLTRMCY